jgi:hypothetical protein
VARSAGGSSFKDFYGNNERVALTRKLTDMLRKNNAIDWQKKESAWSMMLRMAKNLHKNISASRGNMKARSLLSSAGARCGPIINCALMVPLFICQG